MIQRLLNAIGWLGQRLGLEDVRFSWDDGKRLGVLLLTCVVTSILVVDFARAPSDELVEGNPAPRTVKASFSFQYQDHVGHQRARAEASKTIRPVFVHRADMAAELQERVATAFDEARTQLSALQQAAEAAGEGTGTLEELPTDAVARLAEEFRDALGVHIPDDSVAALARDGFSSDASRNAQELLAGAMDNLVLRDRENLPHDGRGIQLFTLRDGEQTPSVLADLDELVTPVEARQQVSLGVLEIGGGSESLDAAATVARALVRANVSFAPLKTEEARREAEAAVPLDVKTFKKGATLFRAGDTLTAEHMQIYQAMQNERGEGDIAFEIFALTLLLLLLLVSLYTFGATYLQAFTTEVRDVAAVGTLLIVTALFGRVVVASSEGIAGLVGFDAEPRSVWYLVPMAGAAMLVRSLLGVGWTWLFVFAASLVCGLMMDLQVLPVVFFVISGVAGAGAVEHARERINVLRAGAYVGMVNAVCVLFIHFVQLVVTEGELSSATAIRPVWSMSFAFLGGIGSAGLVLFLTPAFEAAGFVTDFRLMELANLNHPLLRELMLRAPGSYHHSVMVGNLAEAGCERIGANGLRAKVASYFHDIGKSVKPPYFVENQRDGVNRHDGLDPRTSARIIISHVTDGGRMAREHGLPQPVIDNIYMHHGSGLLQYFYIQAMKDADDPDDVDQSDFRYPGPKPNTKEAGVIMLADKVEAATRTLPKPDEQSIREMISKIISSVIADGQFSECPLTLEEIHAVADTFVQVLLGIYHHRIEYPEMEEIERGKTVKERRRASDPPKEAFITLEILPSSPGEGSNPPEAELRAPSNGIAPHDGPDEDASPEDDTLDSDDRRQSPEELAAADEETSDVIDYESLDYLPGRDA